MALLSGGAAEEVEAALAAARVDGPVAVLGSARLARRLGDGGRAIVCIALAVRPLRRLRGRAVVGRADALPLATASVAALVADVSALGDLGDDWELRYAEWCRPLVSGAVLVVVDRSPPVEVSTRALCGGLRAIEQRVSGRTVVTSGTWIPL